ncbi:MAG: hypothetical protein K8E66_10955 [Phycisphaerales bacterium]|nr:hypothetical protein [Phycisphaerales bacterium]
MAIVGAFARVASERFDRAVSDLEAIEGVSTFALDDPDKVGLLVETPSMDDAHGILTTQIPAVIGVLGAWPVYANTEDETENN